MKINITAHEALNLQNQVNGLNKGVTQYWFASKIRQWNNDNSIVINRLITEHNSLLEKYFELKDGNIVYEGEGKDRKPKVIEGKTEEEYKSELALFQQQQVRLEV